MSVRQSIVLLSLHIGADHASFAGDFDLPLQLITRSENKAALDRCFAEAGMEAPVLGDTEGDGTEDEPVAGIGGE